MTTYILWTAFTWTFKGILCTCRFLWICPYNAIKFLPRERHITEDTSRQLKLIVGSESKVVAAIPGSPDRTGSLHHRLTKTEKDILSLKTRVACEKASWERRFTELQRKHEELHNQLVSHARVLVRVGSDGEQGESGGDNGETFEECSSKQTNTHTHTHTFLYFYLCEDPHWNSEFPCKVIIVLNYSSVLVLISL
ncbi:uncharacterized protein LOC131976946 [Centropristis striata]|uniref:uncharacterized protein LOC131976946 n=1 Tax=Centropristis striata TaxID=184440 RepID=UPI0027DFFE39|nr:uncharacterized protein LOC131976946 [Centropristis striata]